MLKQPYKWPRLMFQQLSFLGCFCQVHCDWQVMGIGQLGGMIH